MTSKKSLLLIVFLSLFPLLAIFLTPDLPHTSDGVPHTIRTAVYLKELLAGQFPVRWASQFDYGYGTPIFVFFSPLPYMIGAFFLALGSSLPLTLKLGFALSYLMAGVFTYLFSRAYFKSEKVALFVAILYQYAPFRLVDMLVRGDLGALYAFAFLPLTLFAIVYFNEKKTFLRFVLLAISAALLPLGHNINGFIFFAMSALFVPFITRSLKSILLTFAAMGYGLLLIAYFLFPALLELKYTNGYIFSKDLFYSHFPSLSKLFLPNILNSSDLRVAEVPVQIGLLHIVMFMVCVILFFRKKMTSKTKGVIIYFLLISLGAFLLMTPVTKPLWENIRFLRQFQFPWRFLSVLAFTSAVLGGFVLQNIFFLQKRIVYLSLIAFTILSTIFYWAPYQGYEKIQAEDFWNYSGSTNYFAEVNTIWMDQEPKVFPKKRIEIIAGRGAISNQRFLHLKHTFQITATENSTVLDRTYFFPGWVVYVDAKPAPIQFQDQNYRGLITFSVLKGTHSVTILRQEDKIAHISDGISLLAIFGLIGGVLFRRRKVRMK